MHVQSQFLPAKGHPLQTNWKFWYVQRFHQPSTKDQQEHKPPQKITDYRERLKDMGTISTIEQFFKYFVYMKKPSEMPREIDLFFFRESEVPMWEVNSCLLTTGRSRLTEESGLPRSRRRTTSTKCGSLSC